MKYGFQDIAPIDNKKYRIIVSFRDIKRDNNELYGNIAFITQYVREKVNFELNIKELLWFTQSEFRHRIANRANIDACFLAGDAYHIFSPIGGLNMNMGLQDALNLGWKLAYVLKGYANDSLLSTYQSERNYCIKKTKENTAHLTHSLVDAKAYRPTRKYINRPRNKQYTEIELPYRLSGYDNYYTGKSDTYREKKMLPGFHFSEFFENIRSYEKACKKMDNTKFNLLIPRTFFSNKKVSVNAQVLKTVFINKKILQGCAWLVRPDGYISAKVNLTEKENLKKTIELSINGEILC
ncbi:MAG: hypothetical protein EXR81_04325 [Gammaproteobacteria bacterium]|nr:hypothetical protein [Gammaproteobacteria bacterium]